MPPAFRLVIWASISGRRTGLGTWGGQQVATRRTRTAGKVEIPNVDDHISKLEHMGKETVKKLQDIKLSASQSGIEISVPINAINKGEPGAHSCPDLIESLLGTRQEGPC